jgi:hypothetical protein
MSFVLVFALSQGLHLCVLYAFLPARRNGYTNSDDSILQLAIYCLYFIADVKYEIEAVVSRR